MAGGRQQRSGGEVCNRQSNHDISSSSVMCNSMATYGQWQQQHPQPEAKPVMRNSLPVSSSDLSPSL
jgi:hypothetical protein